MEPKNIADIPLQVIALVFAMWSMGLVNVRPLVIFLVWVIFATSFIFLMVANVIGGGYKNDWHRNEATGDKWREGLIAVGLLFGYFAFFIAQFFWEASGVTDTRILIGTVFAGIIFGYLNVKFRYNIFEQFSPTEKEAPIKIREIGKYIKWYVWLIILLYFITLFAYTFPIKT